MKRKIISLALSVLMVTFSLVLAGCGGGGGGQSKEPSSSGGNAEVAGKTNVYVATYNGGLGMEWLNSAADRFEKKYAEHSFEEGKKGVAVHVEEAKAGEMLINTNLNKDVYLTESVDYFLFQKSGKIADITDAVTADLSAYGESGKTIESKLDDSMKSFLTAKEDKYYAVPFYDGIYGLVYDADMFALKGWYLDESGNFTKTNKSTGIDGVAGTYDDGLPKTYAQFGKLVDKIRGDGVTPFIYSTESMVYFINMLANYWADYEGKVDMEKNWTLSGTTDVITSFNGNTPVIGTATITQDNVEDLQKQPGKYYALKFLKETLMGNASNYVSATDFKAAQAHLIQSCLDGEMQEGAVAMVIDGAWFENEADLYGTFDLVKMLDLSYNGTGDYKKTRNLAFMPIPMVDDSQATLDAGSKTASGAHKQTLVSSNDSFCFVSAGTTGGRLDASKEFVKFLHTDAELSAFTATTSITRPYNYTISESVKAEMSYFAKTLSEIKANSDIVYPYSDNDYYVANSSKFRLGQWAWKSVVDGIDFVNPFVCFHTDGEITAKGYFEGLYLAQ